MLPHPPYVVNREDYEFFPNRSASRTFPRPRARAIPGSRNGGGSRASRRPTRRHGARARRAYFGLVRKMDRMIGDILAALDRNGLRENTLIVYASDHGDHVGDRGLFWKHTFYDESWKVPMILSWPGRLPTGERRDAIVSLVDLTATLIEALGADPLPGMDGTSFLSVAENSRQSLAR